MESQVVVLCILLIVYNVNLEEEKNVFRIVDNVPTPPSVNMSHTFYWLQGVSHMYINSTVKSLTPVQVIWDFKYYKVSKKINSCIYINIIL